MAFSPFMIEFRGEIVTVFAMYDSEGNEVQDRSEARLFDVVRESGKIAQLRFPHPETNLTKVERH